MVCFSIIVLLRSPSADELLVIMGVASCWLPMSCNAIFNGMTALQLTKRAAISDYPADPMACFMILDNLIIVPLFVSLLSFWVT